MGTLCQYFFFGAVGGSECFESEIYIHTQALHIHMGVGIVGIHKGSAGLLGHGLEGMSVCIA